jgi:hypothetical protein
MLQTYGLDGSRLPHDTRGRIERCSFARHAQNLWGGSRTPKDPALTRSLWSGQRD